MPNSAAKTDPGWIIKVKSDGPVPLVHGPNDSTCSWASPPGDTFKVRGPDYLSTRAKVPGGDYLLKPLGFDWIKSSTKIGEVLNHPNSRVRKIIEEEFPTGSGDKPFVWAFNLQIPSKDNYSAVAYFTSTEPTPKGSLMDRFLEGDDRTRNSRLKLIANIVEGPWVVRKSVGEQAICIIGRSLSCKYCLEKNFLEVDVDIGSNMVANAIVHLALGYIKTLTVDLAFLIESQTESELPERLLGAIRISNLNPNSAWSIGNSNGSGVNLQSSLSTRLWKTIGNGFSQILQSGSQDNVGSTMDHEDGGKHIIH